MGETVGDEAKSRDQLLFELRHLHDRVASLEREKEEVRLAKLAVEKELVRQRTLMDQSRDGIVILDHHGKVVEANWKFAEMLGYSPEEVLSLHAWEWDAQMTRDELDDAVRLIDESGDHFTSRHRRKDGSIYDVEITTTAAIWEGQKRIFCVCRDISDRVKVERDLRESEERYRQIAENIREVFWIADAEMTSMLYISPAYERIWGKSCESLYSDPKSWTESIHPDDRQKVAEAIYPRTEQGHFMEYRIIRPEGSVRWVLDRGFPISDASGAICRLVGIAEDVTERKLAEEGLREREEIFRAIVEQAAEGIVLIDPETLGFVEFNDSACHGLGYSREEFSHLSLADIQGVFTREEITERLETLLKSDRDTHFENRQRRKDGTFRDILISNRTVNFHGHEYLVGIWLDVTERKRAEETLCESSQRFQSIFNSMGEMVVLHELICDPDGRPFDYRILDCNPAFTRSSGIPNDQAVGALASQIYGTGQPPYLERYAHVAMTGERDQLEVYFPPMQKHFRISVASPKPGHFVTVATDITESVQQEREIKLLNRLYSVLSQVSQAVVSATDAESFLAQACRSVVEEGGFLLSWIGFVETLTNRVLPSTICGEASDYARSIRVYSDDRPEGRGPTGTCIRERRPVVYNDFQKDPLSEPWRARASLFGINSVAAFPILTEGDLCGALTIYSDSVGFFSEKDVELLEKVAGNIGFALDNLERRRLREEAELALKTSEQNYRNLFENAPVGIFRTSSRGQVLEVNCTMAQMLGLKSPQEALERYSNLGSQLYVHPERREQFVNLLRKQGHLENFEYEAKTLDGRGIWLSMNARAQSCDNDGELIIEGFTTDITESKQAEAMLRRSEERYRLLAEQSLQGIAILRGIPSVFVYVNPRWTEIFGYTAEEVFRLGPEAMWDLVHPDDRPMVRQRHRERLMGLQVTPIYEFRIVRKDGSVRWVEVFGSVITSGEEPSSQAVYVDITDRKRAEAEKQDLEAQLRQAQKLEAIGTLAGGIAHDFNNILAPIIGYTEMVLSDLPESTSARDDLEQVLSAAHRARDLVKQILVFSRRGQDQKRIPVDLSPIVREVLKLMRASLPTSIEIRESIQSGTALADATQIHQVIVNLCTNASHAMEDSGVLTVTLSNTELNEGDLLRLAFADLKPGGYLKLSVADTGKGMDKDTICRIFDPYFTTKEVGKGTGLGLAVVHGIIKRHEGVISVSSELGNGTVFDVYIPSINPQGAGANRKSQDLPGGSERVLLVDDEPMVAELGARILKQLGYRVENTTNVLDALKTFHQSPHDFDLIVTDYSMPGMTGTEFANEVLKIRPDMPVILCTGYSEKGTEAAVRELGVRGYALKPLDRRQLAELVRSVLDEEKP